MLFDLTHILYMAISVAVTVGALALAARFLKTEKGKVTALRIVAVVTIVLHYSNIWVEYLAHGGSTDGLEGGHLFPIYPCHIMMWLLLVTAFCKKRSGILFTLLSEFCFWGGIVCASIGILLNEGYAADPTLLLWKNLKSFLSHSTLILGCAYLLVGKFIKIRVFNVVSVAAGLCLFLADGFFVNMLFAVCGLPEVNAMYLLYSPFPALPWLSPMLMGLVALALLFVGLACYELRFPKTERWYSILKNKIEDRKSFIKKEKE